MPRNAMLFPVLVLTVAACGGSPTVSGDAAAGYDVEIRWTSYGIPHVRANDWGSLGYGFAYATAIDGVCVFAREVAVANGSLSEHFGADDETLASDIFHKAIVTDDKLRAFSAALSTDLRAYNAGFVAGYNRYLRDYRGQLPASCNEAAWVRPISEIDLGRMLIAFGIRYGLGAFAQNIAGAAPPGQAQAAIDLDLSPLQGIGSNAVAIGSALSASGHGILLGNPHYPWEGPARFHMIHTTIPGEVDVMGASLLAGSFVAIGFNKDVAWTHTVSTAGRFTLFELELNPDDPMQYRFGDEYRDIEPRVVSAGGEQHTVYMSHHGPILVGRAFSWNEEKAYAVRDAILDNAAALPTYQALQTAGSVADVEDAISLGGIYFVNTIAADRHGNAFYGDISSTPNVDDATLLRCRRDVPGLPAALPVLDGSDPSCQWRIDARSAIPGNMPAEDMPRATSRDYFTNSNDSYWLSNPERPLEGYPRIIGTEKTPRSLRTRAGLVYLDEKIADDGKVSPGELQAMLFSHRHYGAELLLDDLLAICGNAEDATADACSVLADWDRTANIDSRGTQLWTEFWERARRLEGLYEVPFDPDEPVATPRGLSVDDDRIRATLMTALSEAWEHLDAAGLEADAAWGELQFTERNGDRIPVPGAPGWHGVFSYIDSGFTEGKGYTPIEHGNSYIQVVTWDDDESVDARGILTYSQSPEPDSPHYADLTRLYARGEWIDLPFSEADILADPELRTIELRE